MQSKSKTLQAFFYFYQGVQEGFIWPWTGGCGPIICIAVSTFSATCLANEERTGKSPRSEDYGHSKLFRVRQLPLQLQTKRMAPFLKLFGIHFIHLPPWWWLNPSGNPWGATTNGALWCHGMCISLLALPVELYVVSGTEPPLHHTQCQPIPFLHAPITSCTHNYSACAFWRGWWQLPRLTGTPLPSIGSQQGSRSGLCPAFVVLMD